MLVDDEARGAFARARALLGMLRAPRLRQELGTALADGLPDGPSASGGGPLGRVGWFTEDGVDVDRVGADQAAIERHLSERGILAYGPITEWPARDDDKLPFVREVVARVFAATRTAWMSEVELNARLSVLVVDVAGVRRFAVDEGLVERASDGSRYWLRAPEQS